jgi:hypothetical protein
MKAETSDPSSSSCGGGGACAANEADAPTPIVEPRSRANSSNASSLSTTSQSSTVQRTRRLFPLFGPLKYVQRVTGSKSEAAAATAAAAAAAAATAAAAAAAAAQVSNTSRRSHSQELKVAPVVGDEGLEPPPLSANKDGKPVYASSLSLHVKQREAHHRTFVLELSLACLVLYVGLGIGVYGYGLEEWGALRAAYFAVVTLTSVGFGDQTPTVCLWGMEGR